MFCAAFAAAPAAGQGVWPPLVPQLEFRRVAAHPAGEPLDEKVIAPGFSLLTKHDVLGLGAEAGRAEAWRQGRSGLRIAGEAGNPRLVDAQGASLPLSPAFGVALRRMNAYFGLTGPTLAHPITPQELAAALRTPAAVDSVRRVFERSLAERILVKGKAYLPELGGELTLDRELAFHFHDDLLRPLLRELVARGDEPAALERLYEAEPEKMALLDPQEILKKHLAKRRQWDEEGKLPREKRDAVLRMVVDTVAELAAGHYSGDAGTQLQNMLSEDWSGRYGGTWHCHPPDVTPDGFAGDYPPSEDDYEAAAKTGEEIVFVFLPDGYDVYQLSLAPGGSPYNRPPPAASYRSESWRSHFRALFERDLRPR
ncbi:MAG: hypothetical protein A2X36_13850 [Elusimicrobia bacterium GWA2_69_24]|nr:MAG: hypothetical protein A2X36_13850 [Elusimicrobia bacterium GWA2_69_24]HBL16718.1 hypothetical protein [Elusimicrobiota bacterium]